MCSPLGHSLLGLTLHKTPDNKTLFAQSALVLLILFSAIAPDLDFVPGFFIGDINRYHHGISHSIGLALIFAAVGSLSLGRCTFLPDRKPLFSILFSVYLFHLIADMLTEDEASPYGIPFLWPFSDSYMMSPVSIFINIEHGPYGGANAAVLDNIFSWHNLTAMAVEALITLPILAFTLWFKHRNRQ